MGLGLVVRIYRYYHDYSISFCEFTSNPFVFCDKVLVLIKGFSFEVLGFRS